MAVHLDDRKVGERIRAHHLGGKNPAIAHGDTNVGRAVDHVIIGDDVAVGRDDHAAAQPVLDPRLLRPHLLAKLTTKLPAELLTQELPERAVFHAIRQIAVRSIGFCPPRPRQVHVAR